MRHELTDLQQRVIIERLESMISELGITRR